MYLYLIFVFAFLLRLINLNQSLWLDESVVAKVVRMIPFHLIPFQFSPSDVHPPLYYMVISLWTHVFGTSEIMLRFPSIIFSLIAGFFVYKIASQWKNKQIALWATIFFLFNPLIIYYSQEARMHMMATALLSIAFYYFVRITKTTSWLRNDIVLFNLFSAMAMLTFYGSAFFITGMIVAGFFMSKKKNGLKGYLSIGLLASLFLLSPLLYLQMMNAKAGLADLKNWSIVLGRVDIKNVLLIFLKFATGRLSWYPKWSYYLAAGVATAITWILVFFGMKKNKLLTFLFMWPLVIGLLVSFIAPMMMYFRFLYLVPVMSLLLVLGIPNKGKFLGWMPIFTGMTIIFSLVYLINPQFHREDWKKMVQDIDPAQPVYMILPSSDPVLYYHPTLPLFEMRNIEKLAIPEHIQIIPYTEEIYGYNHVTALEKKGCIRESRSEYRGPLLLEKWKCPSSFIGHVGVGAI